MSTKEFGLQGIDELSVRFGAINYDLKYKGGRYALRKAANIVMVAARQRAQTIDDPKTREMVFKNLVVRFGNKTFKKSGDLLFRIGVLGGARDNSFKAQRRNERRRKAGSMSLGDLGEIEGQGKNNPGGDTFYWRFLEFGTETTQAHPFMRPALESNVSAATNEFVVQYRKSIDRAIKKAKRVAA
jgi:HK97 gp10 family phage protein